MNKQYNTIHGQKVREQIRQVIIDYIQQHGYPPTVREIGEAVGLKSTSGVKMHLDRMFADGILETDASIGTPRAIRVPEYKFVKEGQKDGGWISCSERLPNESGSYLVTTYSNGISQYISDIDQFIYNGMPDGYWANGEEVIAWQPLPEAYRI